MLFRSICDFFQFVPQVDCINQHFGLAVPVIDDNGQLLLERWEKEYAPQTPEEAWNPLFVEALQKKAHTEYLLDILLSGSMEERACVVAKYGKEVRKIEQRISEFTASHPASRHERMRPSPKTGCGSACSAVHPTRWTSCPLTGPGTGVFCPL